MHTNKVKKLREFYTVLAEHKHLRVLLDAAAEGSIALFACMAIAD